MDAVSVKDISLSICTDERMLCQYISMSGSLSDGHVDKNISLSVCTDERMLRQYISMSRSLPDGHVFLAAPVVTPNKTIVLLLIGGHNRSC